MTDPQSISRTDLLAAFAKLGIDLTYAVDATFGPFEVMIGRHYRDERGDLVLDSNGAHARPLKQYSIIRIADSAEPIAAPAPPQDGDRAAVATDATVYCAQCGTDEYDGEHDCPDCKKPYCSDNCLEEHNGIGRCLAEKES